MKCLMQMGGSSVTFSKAKSAEAGMLNACLTLREETRDSHRPGFTPHSFFAKTSTSLSSSFFCKVGMYNFYCYPQNKKIKKTIQISSFSHIIYFE